MKTCIECECYKFGVCKRYPQEVKKEPEDFCFEFRPDLPPDYVLDTDLDIISMSSRLRTLYRRLDLQTVRDLLEVPRSEFLIIGFKRREVRELAAAMKAAGVTW